MSTKNDNARLEWIGTVHCEYGGPMIVANAADYENWLGAMPYPLEERPVLHYWGQFTAELPAPFAQKGGHVFRECENHEDARELRDTLLAAIMDEFPDAKPTVDDEDGTAHVLLADNRQLWIEFSPKSQYEEACDDEYDVWEHEYETPSGARGEALFWQKEGAGQVLVATTAARDELVLLRMRYLDDDKREVEAKALVDTPPESEEPADDVAIEVGGRPTIIAYSPINWFEILGPTKMQALTKGITEREEGRAKLLAAFAEMLVPAEGLAAAELSADHAEGCGVALDLAPGRYRASVGHYDDDKDWSAIWCRLSRTDD